MKRGISTALCKKVPLNRYGSQNYTAQRQKHQKPRAFHGQLNQQQSLQFQPPLQMNKTCSENEIQSSSNYTNNSCFDIGICIINCTRRQICRAFPLLQLNYFLNCFSCFYFMHAPPSMNELSSCISASRINHLRNQIEFVHCVLTEIVNVCGRSAYCKR